jgi:hypothetical protein
MDPCGRRSLLRALGYETTRVDLASPLQREECVRRLSEQVEQGWGFSSARPVIGRVDDSSFRLCKRIDYRNSFQTLLRGTFVEESRRTVLLCRFGPHPTVRVFMIVWLTFTGLMAIASVAGTMAALRHGWLWNSGDQWMPIVMPPLMFCFGIALFIFGRFIARNEQDFLVRFLAETLDARALPPSPGKAFR